MLKGNFSHEFRSSQALILHYPKVYDFYILNHLPGYMFTYNLNKEQKKELNVHNSIQILFSLSLLLSLCLKENLLYPTDSLIF